MVSARRLTCTFMLAALFTPLFAAAPVAAQSWPTRSVKFILTLGPGSGADIGARLLADRLTKKWDQPIVIENRPGGDGILAINAFVSAQDDHILLFAPSSSFIGHPYQHDNLPACQLDDVPECFHGQVHRHRNSDYGLRHSRDRGEIIRFVTLSRANLTGPA
jgi:tripartite-type tricarboxylate transporter receptor subunit TctC